jgi:hypothetical protein
MFSVDPSRMDAHARANVGGDDESDRNAKLAARLPTERAIHYAAVGYARGGPDGPKKAKAIMLVVRDGISMRAAARETGLTHSIVHRLVTGFRGTLKVHALAASTLRRRTSNG